MPEPAALGPRRLWRTLVRPLVEEAEGDIVCDTSDAAIVEGLLAATQATIHAVRRSNALDQLSEVYRDRIVFHRDPLAVWKEVLRCRLAVVDIARASEGHMDALTTLVQNDGHAPPVLIQGLADRAAGDPLLVTFTRHGWAVIELPGFEQIRLVLPAGQRILDGPTLDTILGRLSFGATAPSDQAATGEAAANIAELSDRVRDLETKVAEADAGRELAERRRAASEDVVATLRRFNDVARADLEHAKSESASLRRLVDSSRAEAAAARAQNARVARALVAVRQDLVRVRDSQSWRVGHWLTRAGRILTFRKPGRTDAPSKAIKRIDAVTPSREDHH